MVMMIKGIGDMGDMAPSHVIITNFNHLSDSACRR